MSDSELVRRIRASYAAFSRGELDAPLELLHPDVVWRPPPNSLEPHPRRGRDEVRRYLALDIFESQRAEPVEIVEEGDRVMVEAEVRSRGRESGVELALTAYHVYTIEDGLAVRFEAHIDRPSALAALRGDP